MQPGDVLYLEEDLPTAEAGEYVVLSLSEEQVCLSLIRENAEGFLCATTTLVWLPRSELVQFRRADRDRGGLDAIPCGPHPLSPSPTLRERGERVGEGRLGALIAAK